MINLLIAQCYDNKYRIDLRTIHRKSSNAKASSIYTDPNFNRDQIVFSDGISSSFKLVHYGHLIFLLGDKSCYPCGGIIEGAYGINWVPIYVLPTGKEIDTSGSIKNTCCVNVNSFNEYLEYVEERDFREFVSDYEQTFHRNDWYSKNVLRILITSYDLNSIEDTFIELRNRNLLNPFELALGSIIYDFGITPEEVFNCLNYSKDLAPQFTYLDYFKTKYSLADSTNLLLHSSDFKNFINSFDLNQIERFFEVQYLVDTLNLDKYYPELMADVLHLRLYRITRTTEYVNPAVLLQARLDPIRITREVVNEFYLRIRKNIRNLENLVRSNYGYSEVGSLYNERVIFEDLKNHFGDDDVLAQFSPKWLGRQRFDIYIKSLNVAIEYNGKQHYEPISFFGGAEGFKKTLARDQIKRDKCIHHNCTLIEIKYDEDLSVALSKIKTLINQ